MYTQTLFVRNRWDPAIFGLKITIQDYKSYLKTAPSECAIL